MININNKTNNYNINFKSFRHDVKGNDGVTKYLGDTCMFRYDLNFNDLMPYLKNKYNDMAKVNVIIHACSDGEEVYSFLSKLVDYFGAENAKKYLPINAFDIDPDHINLAKIGKYEIEKFELEKIFLNLRNNSIKYFNNFSNNIQKCTIVVNEELKKLVSFNVSNILDDAKNIKFKNTILFLRNVWPYLSRHNEELALFLSKNMDITSTLIIGDFDKKYGIDNLLTKHGFKESLKVKNVFYKEENEILNKCPKYLKLIKKLINK